MLQCLSVRIHILPKQHHFHDTVLHKTFNLPDDILRISAPLTSAHIRHNTVAAEVIAAKHNIDTGFKRKLSFARQIFDNFICIFPDVNNHPL